MNRLFLYPLSLFVTIIVLSCDGALRIKGYTLTDFHLSGMVADSVFSKANKNYPVQEAEIGVYLFFDKNQQIHNIEPVKILKTDSSGFFEWSTVIPPFRKMHGALVVKKEGFHTDTLSFEFKSSPETCKFLISMKKLK